MSDIATRLRQTRANMIGTDDEQHFFDCHEAAGEIERLRQWGRLTDAEREAVEAAARIIDAYEDEMDGFSSGAVATLRGLLERLK